MHKANTKHVWRKRYKPLLIIIIILCSVCLFTACTGDENGTAVGIEEPGDNILLHAAIFAISTMVAMALIFLLIRTMVLRIEAQKAARTSKPTPAPTSAPENMYQYRLDSEPRSEPTPVPRSEPTPVPRPKPAPKSGFEPTPKPMPEPRPIPRPVSKPDPRPAPRPMPNPKPNTIQNPYPTPKIKPPLTDKVFEFSGKVDLFVLKKSAKKPFPVTVKLSAKQAISLLELLGKCSLAVNVPGARYIFFSIEHGTLHVINNSDRLFFAGNITLAENQFHKLAYGEAVVIPCDSDDNLVISPRFIYNPRRK